MTTTTNDASRGLGERLQQNRPVLASPGTVTCATRTTALSCLALRGSLANAAYKATHTQPRRFDSLLPRRWDSRGFPLSGPQRKVCGSLCFPKVAQHFLIARKRFFVCRQPNDSKNDSFLVTHVLAHNSTYSYIHPRATQRNTPQRNTTQHNTTRCCSDTF